MNKRDLSERENRTKLVTPAIEHAGWLQAELREEAKLTDGHPIARGDLPRCRAASTSRDAWQINH
jgi:type I restriction enzyme, R subunit